MEKLAGSEAAAPEVEQFLKKNQTNSGFLGHFRGISGFPRVLAPCSAHPQIGNCTPKKAIFQIWGCAHAPNPPRSITDCVLNEVPTPRGG